MGICHLGGDYSLDMSSDHPQARCSIHGTTDSYSEQPDIDERHRNDWYYSSLKIAMIVVAVGAGIGLLLLLRSRRLRREKTYLR